MPFMPFDSFISIKTSTISQFRGFDGLTINHCSTGFGSSARFYSGLPMEKLVNQEPSVVLAPFIVVVINTLPQTKTAEEIINNLKLVYQMTNITMY